MKEYRKKWLKEAAVIMSAILLFFSTACYYHRGEVRGHIFVFALVAVADLILLGYAIHGIGAWFCNIRREKGFRNVIRDNKGVMAVMCYCFLTRICQMKDRPRWDAMTYYEYLESACREFDFTWTSFFKYFSLAHHPALGFASFTAVGEFLDPDGYFGVKVVWLLLSMLSGYCLYRIFEKILPACSSVFHFLSSYAVMSTPVVLGTFHYYQPDAGLVCFFIFVLYCYLYQKNLLLFFSMLLLTQSKEVGALALAGFGCGVFLRWFLREKRTESPGKRVLLFFREPVCRAGILTFFALLLWMILYRLSGGSVWSHRNSTWSSPFTFNPVFILFKCKQYFILNFNWLVWGGSLVLAVLLCFLKRGEERKALFSGAGQILLPVFLAAAAQMVFYASYITYTAPRYHVLIDMCGMLLFVILVGVFCSGFLVCKKAPGHERQWVRILMAGLCVLSLTEAYITIDPVSLSVFQADDTGEGYIIYEDYWNLNWRTDFTVYNHQFAYLDHVYDDILRDVGYHENMDAIVWDYVELGGLIHDTQRLYWDTEKNQRVLKKNDNTFLMNAIVREQIENHEVTLHKDAVFMTPQQFGPEVNFSRNWLQENQYRILSEGFVKIPYGGKVTYFVCEYMDGEGNG